MRRDIQQGENLMFVGRLLYREAGSKLPFFTVLDLSYYDIEISISKGSKLKHIFKVVKKNEFFITEAINTHKFRGSFIVDVAIRINGDIILSASKHSLVVERNNLGGLLSLNKATEGNLDVIYDDLNTLDSSVDYEYVVELKQSGSEACLHHWTNYDDLRKFMFGTVLKGESGVAPYIGDNGNWFVYNNITHAYEDSGVSGLGSDGIFKKEGLTTVAVGGISKGSNLYGLKISAILEKMLYGDIADYLEILPTSANIPFSSKMITINVTSSNTWNVNVAVNWVVVRNKTSNSVVLEVFENNGVERSTNVVFTSGSLQEIFTLTQSAKSVVSEISINPSSSNVSDRETTIEIDVTSNTTWVVRGVGMFKSITPSEGSGNGEVVVVVYENTSGSSRSGAVTFETKDGLDSAVLNVLQSSASFDYINIDPSSKEVSKDSGNTDVLVDSNVDWSLTYNESWLTVIKTQTGFSISYEKNSIPMSRSSVIKLSGGSASVNFTLVQLEGSETLSASPTSHNFIQSGGYIDIYITSNTNWVVYESTLLNTCGVDKTEGTGNGIIRITADENPSSNKITSNFKISTVNQDVYVALSQDAYIAPYITPSQNSIEVSKESGSVTISVDSNVTWVSSSDANWVVPTKSGDNLILTYEANPNAVERRVNIVLSGEGITSEINIVQQYNDIETFIVSPVSHEFPIEGGEVTVNVSSNNTWVVFEEDLPTWITIGDYEGSGNGTFKVTCGLIPVGQEDLNYNLQVRSSRGTTELVNLTQPAPEFSVDINIVNAPNTAGTATVVVTANFPWTATSDSAWATTQINGNEVIINYTANLSASEERKATITIGGLYGSEEVEITQAKALELFSVTPKSHNFLYTGGSATFTVTSNNSWYVFEEDLPSWISVNSYEGSGNGTFSINCTTIPVGQSVLDYNLQVRSSLGTIELINITQNIAPYITPSTIEVKVSKDALNVAVEVDSNVNWSATSEASWTNPTRLGKNLIIYYEENENAYLRRDRITLSGEGVTAYVDIEQEGNPIEIISVSPLSHEFPQLGGEVILSVTSNANWVINKNNFPLQWNIEGDIVSGTGNDTIKIIAAENISSNPIEYILGIATSNKSINVELNQLEYIAPYITPSKTSIDLPAIKGSDETIVINANVDWDYTENSSWFNVTRNGNNLLLSYATNDLAYQRAGSIVITSEELEDVYINITQGANSELELIISPSSWNDITYAGGNRTFTVESNGLWYVDRNNEMPDWIESNVTTGNLSGEFTLTVSENTNETDRISFVTVAMDGKSVNVPISQNKYDPPYITPEFNSDSFESIGGTKRMNIESNVDWSVGMKPDWLNVTKIGSEIVYTCSENTSVDERLGTIVLTGGSVESSIIITQYGASVSELVVTPMSFNFEQSGGSKTFSVTSNGTWYVDRNNEMPSWLSSNIDVGSDDGSFILTAEENISASTRNATISVSIEGKTVNITITQDAYIAPSGRYYDNSYNNDFNKR